MSLSCFFGAELKPDGAPFTPVMPPQSSLVITQCAVTAAVPSAAAADEDSSSSNAHDSSAAPSMPATYSAVTLYAQSSEVPTRLAVCTLSPGQQLYYYPLQLIFNKSVTFTLMPQHKPLREGAPVAYPTVHLTGYFEKEEDDMDEEDEEDGMFDGGDDDEGVPLHHSYGRGAAQEWAGMEGVGVAGDADEEEEEEEEFTRGRRPPSRAGGRRPNRH